MVQRCYWDYLRVYVPAGSELLEADGLKRAVAAPGERGTTVLAGDFELRPSEQHTVTLRYRLPFAAASAPYRLDVRKQGGALPSPLSVAIGQCKWITNLDRDRTFECSAGTEWSSNEPNPAKASPLTWQQFLILGILALIVLGLWIWGGRRATRTTRPGERKQDNDRT